MLINVIKFHFLDINFLDIKNLGGLEKNKELWLCKKTLF